MKMKRILSIVLTLCMVLSMLPVGTLATEDAPALVDGYYEIYTADQLYWFAAEVNSGKMSINGKLMADIVVNENVLTADGTLNGDGFNFRVWTPIGNKSKRYGGTFDGNGKTISGLYFNDTSYYVGLFGYLDNGGYVMNVAVVDSYLSGRDYVGGVVGYFNSGTVSNCYNTGNVSGSSGVGGVVGDFYSGTVSNCYNTGSVIGSSSYVGGVVGLSSGTISGCYNTGSVSGSFDVGGVVGYNYDTVSDCYNTGSISGGDTSGGVVGSNPGAISNCYNTGSVSGGDNVGGVVGCTSGAISNCYNTGSISGGENVGGVVGRDYYSAVSNCYYLFGCVADGNDYGTAKTVEQFASGEVAYLLQGEQVAPIWGQEIGVDKYPMLYGDKVYRITDGDSVLGYSNVEGLLPTPGTTISGNVTSFLEGDVTIELIQDGEVVYSVTVSGGEYAIEGVVAGEYTLRISKANHAPVEIAITVGQEPVTQDAIICPIGDVTGDGVVNIKDFQRLLRHINKTNPLEDYALLCGDVTGDGNCNIKDLQRLLRHVNKTYPLH